MRHAHARSCLLLPVALLTGVVLACARGEIEFATEEDSLRSTMPSPAVAMNPAAGADSTVQRDSSMLAGPAPAAALDPAVASDLERLRAATDSFHDVTVAYAAGYPTATPQCLANASAGAMGRHYVHRGLLDDSLSVEHPEILLYAPQPDGSQQLVAVEYIVPLTAWHRDEPPRIFGQSLARSDELGLWYLHVWAWEPNEAGLFANWNRAVTC